MFHLFYELGGQTAEETTFVSQQQCWHRPLQIAKWLLIDVLQIYRIIRGNLKG